MERSHRFITDQTFIISEQLAEGCTRSDPCEDSAHIAVDLVLHELAKFAMYKNQSSQVPKLLNRYPE